MAPKQGEVPDGSVETVRRAAALKPASESSDGVPPLLQEENDSDSFFAGFAPSAKTAASLLLVVRLLSATASIIPDCDETYNYWEPLHQLLYPPAPGTQQLGSFKTWEYDPRFAIRSWAYLLQFAPLKLYISGLGLAKHQYFYLTRAALAWASSSIEARFYGAVKESIGPRPARYLLIALLGCAGIFETSTALVPSAYTFYTTTLGWSFVLPLASKADSQTRWLRCRNATLAFAVGTLLGWPFAIVLAIPFVVEELFLSAGSIAERVLHLARASLLALAVIALPVLLIDTLAYGRTSFVPWNIVAYNVLSKARGAGPELYGVEPKSYYLRVLLLSFNFLAPLALLSAPLIVAAGLLTPNLLESRGSKAATAGSASAKTNMLHLLVRVSPAYTWLALLSSQSHKEERFLYPAYALLCLNAAISVSLLHHAIDATVRTVATRIKGQEDDAASRMSFGALFAWAIIISSAILGVLRSAALTSNYSAPLHVLSPLWSEDEMRRMLALRGEGVPSQAKSHDLARTLAQVDQPVRLCYAGEWYRFSTSFLVPQGVQPELTRSAYANILPGHFPAAVSSGGAASPRADALASALRKSLGWAWPYKGSSISEADYNEFNEPEPSHVIDPAECDYVVDIDFKNRHNGADPAAAGDSFIHDHAQWERVRCLPLLDNEASSAAPGASALRRVEAALARALWLPRGWGSTRKYADFCLLRRIVPTGEDAHDFDVVL